MKWKYYSAGIIAPPGARGVVILNSSAGNQPSSKCMIHFQFPNPLCIGKLTNTPVERRDQVRQLPNTGCVPGKLSAEHFECC
jgi:hypothetical protein